MDDIDSQHQQFKSQGLRHHPPTLGLLAICFGSGFTNVLKELGCHSVINCVDIMNPSAQEIITRVEGIGAKQVAEEIKSGQVVTIFNDIGERYFSTSMWG